MLDNKEGNLVPDVTFITRRDGDWTKLTSDDIFKGKKVIVFSLPGAFTPTCSSTHLPRYNYLAKSFKVQGIDDIVCLSVNDGFVMEAWAQDQESNNVSLLADGNGDFTEAMGMLVDKTDLGFGKRSWRYSMYVEDKVIKKMFIEPQKEGDPFEVSDADTMANYLFPDMKKPANVSLITRRGCPHCAKAKELLSSSGYDYDEVIMGEDITSVGLFAISGKSTAPQVFIDGKHIGGADDLAKYLK